MYVHKSLKIRMHSTECVYRNSEVCSAKVYVTKLYVNKVYVAKVYFTKSNQPLLIVFLV